MKKLFSLFLTAFLITTTGCNSSDPDTADSGNLGDPAANSGSLSVFFTSSNDPSKPAGETGVTNTPTETPLTLLCESELNPFRPSGCSTADGYYSIQRYIEGERYSHITYIDYASGQEVILCSDSSCGHDSERCASVVTGDFMESELFFWNGYLYYFEASYDNEGSFSSGGWSGADGEYSSDMIMTTPAKLYKMDPDGTNRTLVYSFPDNYTVERAAIGDKNGIWFIQKELVLERDEKTEASHIGSKNKALVKLDLSEKKIVEQIPVPSNDNIIKDFVGVCGSKFIFDGTAYPDGKSAMDYMDILAPRPTMAEEIAHMDESEAFRKKCDRVFFELDTSDKALKELCRINLTEAGRGQSPVGDRLYISRDDDTEFSLDLNSGAVEEINVPSGYRFEGFVGERPLYITTDKTYKRFFLDPETGGMIPCILDGGASDVIAICGDFALVIYETTGTPLPSGGMQNPYDIYALISLDDLYNGRANFKMIDMLERNNRNDRA
ncbi:MAG: hypothetical protein K2J80_09450 [Oscillospiraceae bacterium]|nr:hypothetical protein [Oscillospiraceae bacterium]